MGSTSRIIAAVTSVGSAGRRGWVACLCLAVTTVTEVRVGAQSRSVRSVPAVRMPRRAAQSASDVITLRAVGDILLGGPMGQLMTRKGRGYPFQAMKPILRAADIAFGNLECCVSDRGKPIPKQYNFRGDPRRTMVLAESGFKVVSVANNHAWDFGRDALEDTVENVRRTGVCAVGAGITRSEAHSLQILTVRGVRVGFLAYLGLLPPLLSESDDAPCLSMASVPVITREVRAARSRVDILIVSLHDGKEGAPLPNAHQKELARAAIDAGADLVIGHHPHVVEPMERYHNRAICYSLGNFVFSTAGRGSGAMLEARLSRQGCLKARLVRLYLDGPQPRLTPPPRHPRRLRHRP